MKIKVNNYLIILNSLTLLCVKRSNIIWLPSTCCVNNDLQFNQSMIYDVIISVCIVFTVNKMFVLKDSLEGNKRQMFY